MKNKLSKVLGTVKTIVKYAGLVMVVYDTIIYFSNRLSEYTESEEVEKLKK